MDNAVLDKFEKNVKDAQVTLAESRLLHVKLQINLCGELARAAQGLVNDCKAQPTLIDTSEKRQKIVQKMVADFWHATDYPSISAFADDLTEEGFGISKILLTHYLDGRSSPLARRLLPLVKTLAIVGLKTQNRLSLVIKDLERDPDSHRISASINSYER